MNSPEKYQILIVDDEEDILELIRYNLKNQGFDTLTAASGEEAVSIARKRHPHLIVLDLMLPGIDGIDICRILKSDPETNDIPIIMLTARGSETDIVKGLESGADDYVTKPFSPSVLVARVKARLRDGRRQRPEGDNAFRYPGLYLHPETRKVKVNDQTVDLTYSEFQILQLLVSHPNLVFTRNQIIDEIRGENYPVTDRSVDFLIVGLRKKLGDAGKLITTVRGVGYCFSASD